MNLETRIGPLTLQNPIMTASGTFGYGIEFSPYFDIRALGAIVVKGLSLQPRPGNPSPRIFETPAGMLNSIGLQNVGLESFLREKLPALRELGVPVIANVLGNTLDEYVELSRRLAQTEGVCAVEINISCPNVCAGGIQFAADPAATAEVTAVIRKAIGAFPMIVKLSPNVTSIVPFARACQEEGADAISLINTYVGIAIDVETMQPRMANIIGGLSGPAIKPLAQKLVYDVCRSVNIPVIGIGGISSGIDVVEYLALGARAVQVGTANFISPEASYRILHQFESWMASHGYPDLEPLIGAFHRQNRPEDRNYKEEK